ncbi:hypothetical protein ENBRE01_0141 [Enteropsectra breve]|nr:hypothetical protein ENBRE01_0141 [Enteropsectra breve]
MKFIQSQNIVRTNNLFSRISAKGLDDWIEFEVYSCKETKEQRKNRDLAKPLRYYVFSLEQTFPDFDFTGISQSAFKRTSVETLRDEMYFLQLSFCKNSQDAEEFMELIKNVLETCIVIKQSIFYEIDPNTLKDATKSKVFMVHDRKQKRVLMIKVNLFSDVLI